MVEFAAGFYEALKEDNISGISNKERNEHKERDKHIAKYQQLLGDDATAVAINYTLSKIIPAARAAVTESTIDQATNISENEKTVAKKMLNLQKLAAAKGDVAISRLEQFMHPAGTTTSPDALRSEAVYDKITQLITDQIKVEAQKIKNTSITDDELFNNVRAQLSQQSHTQGSNDKPNGNPGQTPNGPGRDILSK